MIAMQYKIKFPNDYNMEIIRKRVALNGTKTDGFAGLLFKAYLIKDTQTKKEYAPLYVWRNEEGMNKFIFEGFYDNILASFGWQNINIATPLEIDVGDGIMQSKILLEIENEINQTDIMRQPQFSISPPNCLGKVLVYNPDKWKYVEFYFLEKESKEIKNIGTLYEILHISM